VIAPVRLLAATAPLAYNAATGALSLPAATVGVDGYLTAGDRATFLAKEPALGNPASDGYILSSTALGVRSWVAAAGGGAPVGSSYLVQALDGTLTNERRLQGTTNQIVLSDGGAGGDMVLSLPQSIHTGASPTFAGVTLGSLAGILKAASGVVSGSAAPTDLSGWPANASGVLTNNGSGTLSWGAGGSGAPVGSSYLVAALDGTLTSERRLQGTANQVILADGGAGADMVLSLPQDVHTSAAPTFGGATVPVAPTATANRGLVSLGSGPFDGATAGFFVGSGSGQHLAINGASGFAGNLFDAQVAGTRRFAVTGAGQLLAPLSGSSGGLVVRGDCQFYGNAADVWRSPDSLILETRLTVGATTLNADQLYVQGTAGNNTATYRGSSTSGQSYGHFCRAGTTSADYCAKYTNEANSLNLLLLRGDGRVEMAQVTSSTLAMVLGGDFLFWRDSIAVGRTSGYIAADSGMLIGATAMSGAEKFRVVGDARIEGAAVITTNLSVTGTAQAARAGLGVAPDGTRPFTVEKAGSGDQDVARFGAASGDPYIGIGNGNTSTTGGVVQWDDTNNQLRAGPAGAGSAWVGANATAVRLGFQDALTNPFELVPKATVLSNTQSLLMRNGTTNGSTRVVIVPNGTSVSAELGILETSTLVTNVGGLFFGMSATPADGWYMGTIGTGSATLRQFYIDATGNTTTATANLTFRTDGTIKVRSYTTTQRDALTPVDGIILYNSTTGKFQGRAAGAWADFH
jgi:hypothetical protein